MIHDTRCAVQVKIVGLTQDKEYRLRVFAVNSQGESEPLGCVDSFITENPFQCPGAPGRPGGCQSGGPRQIPDILLISAANQSIGSTTGCTIMEKALLGPSPG